MKNALILHGTGNDSTKNWFSWLKKELEELGFLVWAPDLPKADKPNIKRYNNFIFSNKDFEINKETILIGHSSGAVEILGLLQNLPKDVTIDTAYLVGSFMDNLGESDMSGLFTEPFDFELIKKRAKKFVFFHSDDDPFCPLEHAKFLAEKTSGELIILPNQKHFSISTAGEKYKEFSELLEIIKQK